MSAFEGLGGAIAGDPLNLNDDGTDDTVDMAAAVRAYPRAKARTLRFSAGAPRTACAIGDGSRALFLRSSGPEDLVASLWVSEFLPADGGDGFAHRERLLADPRVLLGGGEADAENLSPEERARRERSREGGHGIVGYSVDAAGRRVAFALDSRLWVADVESGEVREVAAAPGPVVSPRIAPDGTMVAYSTVGAVHVVAIGGAAHDGTAHDGNDAIATEDRAGADAKNAGSEDTVIGVITPADVDLTVPADDVGAVSIGLADFIAGEEMDRYDGLWWSPDSGTLLVQTTDESSEPLWHISDPANPETPASARHYPRALTVNARVRLFAVPVERMDANHTNTNHATAPRQPRGRLGAPAEIIWDAKTYEYLAVVRWTRGDGPLLLVQNRRQNADQVLLAKPPATTPTPAGEAGADAIINGTATGDGPHHADATHANTAHARITGDATSNRATHDRATHDRAATWPTRVLEEHANAQWLDLFAGAPAFTPDGRLVCAVNDMDADANRLTLDGQPFTSAGVQVRRVLDVTDEDVLAVVSTDPRGFDVVSIGFDGRMVTLNQEPGVWTASRAGTGTVVWGRTMDDAHAHMMHIAVGRGAAMVRNLAMAPGFVPNARFVELGEHALLAAVTMPSPGSAADLRLKRGEQLPVLLKPYGGPCHQEVVYDQSRYWDAQWWADQGFIVLTADGRGTPGRGPAWDRELFEDFKGVTLADQVEALESFAQVEPAADMSRVAMIGWSYGGFLSAAAVLDAPDSIHAACAGAPPTDWTLYDTHYTERYLGLDPDVYRRNSLIEDAPGLRRPLLLIHGFADDNVTVAHTLRLSQALLAAGRAHEVLPLNGITHMTNDETVAENLLLLERDFLRRALGVD